MGPMLRVYGLRLRGSGGKGTMAHRHLVLAYVITILGQIGYAGWVWWKYQSMRKLERQFPPYPVVTK
jgi:hypothetical protein